jgi:hypothetical protein
VLSEVTQDEERYARHSGRFLPAEGDAHLKCVEERLGRCVPKWMANPEQATKHLLVGLGTNSVIECISNPLRPLKDNGPKRSCGTVSCQSLRGLELLKKRLHISLVRVVEGQNATRRVKVVGKAGYQLRGAGERRRVAKEHTARRCSRTGVRYIFQGRECSPEPALLLSQLLFTSHGIGQAHAYGGGDSFRGNVNCRRKCLLTTNAVEGVVAKV